MKASNILIIIVVLVIAGAAWWLYGRETDEAVAITSFEECVAAGYPVMESYPEQCRTADGQTFVRKINIDDEVVNDGPVRVNTPSEGETVTSPLTVTGEARGTWYFEASFPIEIQDAEGNILVQAPAQAQGEWMTEDFVPFEVTLNFAAPSGGEGKLILRKDNPSGLPENDAELVIPIQFGGTTAVATGGCVITGCSGQICAAEETASTCEFRPEYNCYKTAQCGRNVAGKCAWQDTTELRMCLANA